MSQYLNFFKLLPFIDATRLSILTFVRRYIFKFGKIIFSQTGEEIIIQWILKDVKKGVYVDVGCHHPYKISNTFKLYLEGWRGIAIDANEDVIRKFKKARPEDISLLKAVSDVEQEVTFYKFKESEVNTIDEKTLKEWKKEWNLESEVRMTTETLTKILDENLPSNKNIDLLTIDVEGNDFNVLKSLNFDKYRPKLIVVELHKFDLSTIQENEVYQFLITKNYDLVSFATMNGYFLDKFYKN
ncbi:FkbM family methyltransferase [Arcicella sp. LKC2W]|uniref:FkbM family methyltransferase n=1 Tax=Arcicella sp. LKC2W TaxID=2984198 RepID=UPI002B216D81|nr:FkbM family methyltransferase [Arcicella sp. LKC2W]MEA5459186.1 FkbM family methyltransferase [Arcicella sp. LKC2W]